MPGPRTARSILPIIVIVVGVMLILGSVLWLLNPFGALPETTSTPAGQGQVAIPLPKIRRVSLQDAKSAYDQKSAVFVDLRGEPYYSEMHIPGALSITLDDLLAPLTELKKTDWIVTYCT